MLLLRGCCAPTSVLARLPVLGIAREVEIVLIDCIGDRDVVGLLFIPLKFFDAREAKMFEFSAMILKLENQFFRDFKTIKT
jgi:hypothetical protein